MMLCCNRQDPCRPAAPRGVGAWLLGVPALAFLLLVLLLTGCDQAAPVAAPSVPTMELTVISEPPGAEVTLDSGGRAYTTPFSLTVDGSGQLLEFRLEGHRTTWHRVPPGTEPHEVRVRLEPASAVVYLDSVPTGATVILNGVRLGQTPLFVPVVPIGQHKAELEMAGYDKREFVFEVKNQRPLRFTTSLVSIMGSLRIQAETPGVTVYLNGALVGQTADDGITPLVVPEVREGEHEIVARKTNFQDLRQSVTVRRREARVVTLPRMVELPGGLEVTSTPSGANVYINGDLRGRAPFLLDNQPPGRVLVKVEREGHDPQIRETEISPNFTRKLHFNLTRNVGGFTITTKPAGCFIYINGQVLRDKTERSDPTSLISRPFVHEGLPEGTHVVRVENPLFEPREMRFLLQKGEMRNLGLVELEEKWLPTHEIHLRDGTKRMVRLHAERPDGAREVWISKQIKVEYKAGEIVNLRPLD